MSSWAVPPAGAKDDAVEMVSKPAPGEPANGYAWEIGGATPAAETDPEDVVEDNIDKHNATTKSTRDDSNNMKRMGRSQELVRHFRLLSVASFVAIATAAWEIGLFEITPGLVDGGRPALVYSVLWNFVGFGPIYLSMAEMASMAPIAGAQYHWVKTKKPHVSRKY
jgi:choline transport protein